MVRCGGWLYEPAHLPSDPFFDSLPYPAIRQVGQDVGLAALQRDGPPADFYRVFPSLEDVGCSNTNLLGHLRGTGPHVRGCWVVDAVLNNE